MRWLEQLQFDLGIAMGWRHVLFANWPVDPDVVESHLPKGLTVDTYDGQAWLSVVPYTNVTVRPSGLPRTAGFRLPELNLRTYVSAGNEPGVYFFSLDADGLLGVVGARLFHHLPYYYARIDLTVSDNHIQFTSRRCHPGARPVDFAVTYSPSGEEFKSDPGSLAEFLTERYRYYTEAPDGSVRYANVHHERWPLYKVDTSISQNTLFQASGFVHPGSDPVHLYSPRVDTVASPSQRW